MVMAKRDLTAEREYHRQYYAAHRDVIRKRQSVYLVTNKDTIRARQRIWQAEDRLARRFFWALRNSRAWAKKRGYLPCSASEQEIEAAFTGMCHNAGCRVPESECRVRLSMDHCHTTGAFRGWLCESCNLAMGHLSDSREKIAGLASYVKGESCQT